MLFFGLLYLRYTTPTYNVSASILIKDDDKNDLVSQMSSISELSGGGSIQNKIENEIEILESRKLLSRVVKDLKLNINYIDVQKYLFNITHIFIATFFFVRLISRSSAGNPKKLN